MKFQYLFEKSPAWHQAVGLAKEVHNLDARFHNHEKYDIIKRLREGSLVLSADIATANTYFTAKKQSKYTAKINRNITRFLSHLLIAKELNFVSTEEFTKLKSKADNILKLSFNGSEVKQYAHV
jgi:four helix bundle protein